jgi:hypothetical protein
MTLFLPRFIIIALNQPSGLMNFTNFMEWVLLIFSTGFALRLDPLKLARVSRDKIPHVCFRVCNGARVFHSIIAL